MYGIDDADFTDLINLRDDVPRLAAHLRERNLFFSINHVFSSSTGKRTESDFELVRMQFPGIETHNGQMLRRPNESAGAMAALWGKSPVGGSDAHTCAEAGLTYTEISHARTKQEYLVIPRNGYGETHGAHGSLLRLTTAVLNIAFSMASERPWTAVLASLLAAIPAATVVNPLREICFHACWASRVSAPVVATAEGAPL